MNYARGGHEACRRRSDDLDFQRTAHRVHGEEGTRDAPGQPSRLVLMSRSSKSFSHGSQLGTSVDDTADLKRGPIGWNQDDFDALENGVIVGRIFKVPIAPQDRTWMWASSHNGHIRRAAHGDEATCEEAVAAFAKSWRRE